MDCQQLGPVLHVCRKHALLPNGKTVLFWHQGGFFSLLSLDLLLALSFQLRGYDVHMVMCDGILPLCTGIADEPAGTNKEHYCARCQEITRARLQSFGFKPVLLSNLLATIDMADIEARVMANPINAMPVYADSDLNVALRDALLRFFRGAPETEYDAVHTRNLAVATLLNYHAAKAALAKFKPWRSVMVHCAYSDHKPPYDVFSAAGVPIISYSAGYVPNSVMLRTILDPTEPSRRAIPLAQWRSLCQEPEHPKEAALFNKIFQQRYMGNHFIDSSQKPMPSKSELMAKYHLDAHRKICLFPLQMNWDVSSEVSSGFYDSYNDLVIDTIRMMCEIESVQWLVKLHPSEAKYCVRSTLTELIHSRFPHIPAHIHLLSGDTPESSLSFFRVADCAVSTSTTSVAELSALGKPCLMASKGFYYRKGFTLDPDNYEDYAAMLKNMANVAPLTQEQKMLARRYLITYMYRCSFSIPGYSHKSYSITNFEDLLMYIPGQNEHIERMITAFENGIVPLLTWDEVLASGSG